METWIIKVETLALNLNKFKRIFSGKKICILSPICLTFYNSFVVGHDKALLPSKYSLNWICRLHIHSNKSITSMWPPESKTSWCPLCHEKIKRIKGSFGFWNFTCDRETVYMSKWFTFSHAKDWTSYYLSFSSLSHVNFSALNGSLFS